MVSTIIFFTIAFLAGRYARHLFGALVANRLAETSAGGGVMVLAFGVFLAVVSTTLYPLQAAGFFCLACLVFSTGHSRFSAC